MTSIPQRRHRLHAVATGSLLSLSAGATMALSMPTVYVGDIGNVADTAVAYNGTYPRDTTTGLGSVNYGYQIGMYEVTAGQYTEFLNAVAATDTHGLYTGVMANPSYSGILRTGTPGNYAYTVDLAHSTRPAQFISFWSAARFANWMANGQGGAGTTETGSYTLTPGAIASNTVTRNAGATWVIPSEDEWYKAAYYKGGSLSAGYWLYPTQSNTLPGNNTTDPGGNNANLALGGPYPNPIIPPQPLEPGYYTTTVGNFINSPGPYGTFDQAGNVAEWNEGFTPTNVLNVQGRGLRGASFGDDQAMSTDRSLLLGRPADYHAAVSGFRVAMVPEPGTWAMLSAGITALLWLGRRRSANGAATGRPAAR